jgi:hypothetical protein
MTSIFVYKYFFSGNKKVLGAWMKFTVKGTVRSVQFIDSVLYVLSAYNGQVILEKINLEDGHVDAEGYVTYLDKRIKTSVTAGSSTINLAYTPDTNDTIKVYDTDGVEAAATVSGAVVTLTTPPATDTVYYVGIPYKMTYQFSEQLFKTRAGESKTPSSAAKLMTRNGALFYHDSSSFDVKVTPKERSTNTNSLADEYATDGSIEIKSGDFRFPVFTDPEGTTIVVESESPFPVNLSSAEFESFVHSRSNRAG